MSAKKWLHFLIRFAIQQNDSLGSKVRSFWRIHLAILISFKIVVIFNTTSAESKQSQLMLYWKWPQF